MASERGVPIKTTGLDAQLNSAIGKANEGKSEAAQHVETAPGTAKNGQDDGKNWKIVGGVVAIVAAVALGGYALKQRKSRREEKEEEAKGLLDQAGRSLKGTGRWLGEKAETVKEKTGEFAGAVGNVADDIGPRVKSAAGTTKDKVGEAIPSGVVQTAASIKDSLDVAGLKAEKEGLKASEKSDFAVRDAADKVIHKTSEAASKVDEKSGGFFGGLKHWLADRKDDTSELAGTAKDKAGEAAGKAERAVKNATK